MTDRNDFNGMGVRGVRIPIGSVRKHKAVAQHVERPAGRFPSLGFDNPANIQEAQ
jgi:hypothetical protein